MWKVVLPAILVACVAVLLIFCDAKLTNDNSKYKETPESYSVPLTDSVTSSEFLLACNINDIECLGQSTVLFLKKTSEGIPDRNILAIDPFVLPSIDMVFDDGGLVYLNNNVNVTGLEHQKIFNVKMNTTEKSVVLTTIADIKVDADVILVFTKLSETLILRGNYTSFATILGKSEYNYDLRTDENGVEYFVVSPETIDIKVVNTPQIKLNPELEETFSNDIYASASSVVKADIMEKTICKIGEKAYKNVIHNIREAANFLPASAFFRNLHSQ